MSRCQSCIDVRFKLFSPSVSLIVLCPVLEFRPSWTLLEVGRASLRVSEMAGAHGSCLSLTRIIFYPRDAMLARYWLWASVSVRLSYNRVSETNGAGFSMGASIDLSYTVLHGNSGTRISKNKGTSLWKFCPNLCALKTTTASRSSQCVVELVQQWWTPSAINKRPSSRRQT